MIVIETERLFLRQYEDIATDADALTPILSDAVTMRFWPRPFTRDEVEAWIRRSIESYTTEGFGRYALHLKESGTLIGDCGLLRSMSAGELRFDLGYIVHHESWGQGYAPEAARALCDLAFNRLGLPVLHANMAHDNIPSQRVAEKIGMTRVMEFGNERNRNIRTFLYEMRGA